jgi:myo-inositol-1(or 4)-monophosphatase
VVQNTINDLVIEAGNKLKQGYYHSQRFTEKEKGHLLSEYDIIINDFLVKEIRRRYPHDTIVSEEQSPLITKTIPCWIIDSIDGTAYFIFGVPFFSISVAKEIDGKIVEAHIFNPISEEYYYSDLDSGKSFMNSNEISVSDVKDTDQALVSFGFSANIDNINRCYNDWKYIFNTCKKGIAQICPALSICNVARGRIEAFIDFGCSYEGQSAASLILANAGGSMWDYNGTDYNHKTKGGLFTNGKIKLGQTQKS